MPQITEGARSILSATTIYVAAQNLLGARRSRQILAEEHIRSAQETSPSILAVVPERSPTRSQTTFTMSESTCPPATLRQPALDRARQAPSCHGYRPPGLIRDVSRKYCSRHWSSQRLDVAEAAILLQENFATPRRTQSAYYARPGRRCHAYPFSPTTLSQCADIKMADRHDFTRIPYTHNIPECIK